MVDKGIIVTLFLDCCFSAAVYRKQGQVDEQHLSTARFLPMPDGRNHIARHGADIAESATALISTFRGVSMAPNWLIDPSGYAILVACSHDEEASEVKVGDEYFGKMSFFLQDLLAEVGPQVRLRDAYRHLRAKFWADTRKQRQTPILYGNGNQPLLGPVVHDMMSAIPVVKEAHGPLTLLASKAHRFLPG